MNEQRFKFDQLTEIIQKLGAGEPSGMDDLKTVLSVGLRFALNRRGVKGIDSAIETLFRQMADLVKHHAPEDPAALLGFICAEMDMLWPRNTTARIGARNPSITRIRDTLSGLTGKERDVLIRQYVRKQRPSQICWEMGISEDDLVELQSRAKARCLSKGGGYLR